MILPKYTVSLPEDTAKRLGDRAGISQILNEACAIVMVAGGGAKATQELAGKLTSLNIMLGDIAVRVRDAIADDNKELSLDASQLKFIPGPFYNALLDIKSIAANEAAQDPHRRLDVIHGIASRVLRAAKRARKQEGYVDPNGKTYTVTLTAEDFPSSVKAAHEGYVSIAFSPDGKSVDIETVEPPDSAREDMSGEDFRASLKMVEDERPQPADKAASMYATLRLIRNLVYGSTPNVPDQCRTVMGTILRAAEGAMEEYESSHG